MAFDAITEGSVARHQTVEQYQKGASLTIAETARALETVARLKGANIGAQRGRRPEKRD